MRTSPKATQATWIGWACAAPRRPRRGSSTEPATRTPARKTAATGLERAQPAARARAAAGLHRPQGGEGEYDAEREGELAVGEQGDDAGREPEGRPASRLAPAVADQAVEEVGGRDHREDADRARAEQRRQRREEDAVGEG